MSKRWLIGRFEVRFVDNHDRLDFAEMTGGKIAMDQVLAGCRFGCDHDHRLIKVDCNRLETAARIAATKAIACRNDFAQLIAVIDRNRLTGQGARHPAGEVECGKAAASELGNRAIGPGLEDECATIQTPLPPAA